MQVFVLKNSNQLWEEFIMQEPADCARYLVWSTISIFELDVGLLPDAIQVFMQAVKKES